jgi:hypothetical protein
MLTADAYRSIRDAGVARLRPRGAQLLEHCTKLLDLATVRGPIAGALRGDRTIVMLLRLSQHISGCAGGGTGRSGRCG